jgi:hypothetical protein
MKELYVQQWVNLQYNITQKTNQECNPENNLNLRNDNLYAIPHPLIELFKKSPAFSIPKAWNELSINVRGQHNKTTFSIALKEHILNAA